MYLKITICKINLKDKFEYWYQSNDTNICVGDVVYVKFGNIDNNVIGIVVATSDTCDIQGVEIEHIKYKNISNIRINKEIIDIYNYVYNKYKVNIFDNLMLFAPFLYKNNQYLIKNIFLKLTELGKYVTKNINKYKCTKTQQQILKYLLCNNDCVHIDSIRLFVKNALYVIQQLCNKKYIEKINKQTYSIPYKNVEAIDKNIVLTEEQKNATTKILNSKKPVLLFGVTGSGKTAVYIDVAKKVVASGKNVLIIIPEISLTPQYLQELKFVFKDSVAIIHSQLSQKEKISEFMRIKNNEVNVVIGAKSAIFAQLENIGLIVIDEEHDPNYRNYNNYYDIDIPYKILDIDVIDLALYRAKYNNSILILGTATPSLESYYKVTNGEYELVELKSRINNQKLPNMSIIDIKKEFNDNGSRILSNTLYLKIISCLHNNKKVILFLNTCGYSRVIKCLDCKSTLKCSKCDISLIYYKELHYLYCKYCDTKYYIVDKCNMCGSSNLQHLIYGTEQLLEYIKTKFSNEKIFKLDRDAVNNKSEIDNIINEFTKSKSAILIGTQMIAMGHDFKNIALVGIVNTNQNAGFLNYNNNEFLFQTITQIAGRCGRDDTIGEIIIQTDMPNNYAIKCAQEYNYNKFYMHEMQNAQKFILPPFCYIIRLLIHTKYKNNVEDVNFINNCSKSINNALDILKSKDKNILYAMFTDTCVKKINYIFRYNVVLKMTNYDSNIINIVYQLISEHFTKNTHISIQINPNSFF